MTLRRNVLLTTALIFAGLFVALFHSSQQIVTDGFAQYETHDTELDVERAVNSIRDEITNLSLLTRDWSAWDDTYAFMADGNPAYVSSNLDHPDAFVRVRLNMLLFVDLDGRVVAARATDIHHGRFGPLPEGIEAHLAQGGRLLATPDSTEGVEGLLKLPSGAWLVSAQPILKSSQEGPARGTLIFGRLLDDELTAQLAASTRLKLDLFPLGAPSLPADVRAAAAQLPLNAPLVRAENEHVVRGYRTYPDVYGEPTLMVRVELPRDVYAHGRRTLGYFVASLMLVGVVSAGAMIGLIEWLVLARLAKLNRSLRRIGQRPRAGARVELGGRDELAELAGAINGALAALERARALEQDRTTVLELIARRQPLPAIFAAATRLVEGQRAGSCCVILLLDDERTVFGGAATPQALLAVLRDPSLTVTVGAADQNGAWQHLAVAVSGETGGANSVERARALGLHPLWALPIRDGAGRTLGVVLTYGRTAAPVADVDMQLADSVCSLCRIAVEQRDLTAQLAYQGTHDALTGLPNRYLFDDQLADAIAAAREARRVLAVLFVDIDRFKHINDTLGHPVGDAVIREVGQRLTGCLGGRGFIARMGGDEFVLAALDLADAREAEELAARMQSALAQPVVAAGRELYVRASIGVSLFPEDGESAAALASSADAAMYHAKRRGGGAFQRFNHAIAGEATERLQLEAALEPAVDRGELLLFYQPQVDAAGELAGYEALLRWQHPELGMVSPARFVPVAEETGLIHPIGDWVLREACMVIAERAEAYVRRRAAAPLQPRFHIAVNVSAAQFARPGFIDRVREALTTAGARPELLELELTETMVMEDFPAALETIRQLKELGVRVAIDDFGTGYSSLSYLQRLPIDTIKIDRSFLEGVDDDGPQTANDRTLLHAITALAHALGIEVVAEGVETEAQRAFLEQIACDRMQGYLFGRPAPLPEPDAALAAPVVPRELVLAPQLAEHAP